MNIVVIDNDELAPGTDFPPLNANKYGWIQYPRLKAEEIVPTCWRTDIIISLNTPLDSGWYDQFKLIRMLIVGRSSSGMLDPAPLQARGVEVVEITDVDWQESAQAEAGCQRIVDTIDRFLEELVADSA